LPGFFRIFEIRYLAGIRYFDPADSSFLFMKDSQDEAEIANAVSAKKRRKSLEISQIKRSSNLRKKWPESKSLYFLKWS
jgi:hypothetical protein